MKTSLSAICLCLAPKSTEMWGQEWRREQGGQGWVSPYLEQYLLWMGTHV